MRCLFIIIFIIGITKAGVLNAAPILWLIAEHNANVGLVTVDVADGSTNVVGDLNIFMQDIAFDNNGALYGTDGNFLFSINTLNGTPTSLYSFNGGNSLEYGSNGLLYGNGGDVLRTIDPLTGSVNDIGAIGFTGAGDLAFHNNKLYMTSTTELIEINPITGVGTSIGALNSGTSTITPFNGAFGLVSASGVLFGVSGTLIFEINTLTGAGSSVVDYAGQGVGFGGGMAINSSVVPVPAAVWLFGSGLLGLIGVSRRKNKILNKILDTQKYWTPIELHRIRNSNSRNMHK